MANGQYNSFPIDWKSLDASQVPYTNTNSGLSATNVQGAVDEISGEIDNLTASEVAYSNSTSGLSADDVQEAIDELASEKQNNLTAGIGITISSDVIDVDTDETLTQSGEPADAKVTGDKLDHKAEIDGYYDDLTVGTAEQLLGDNYVEDSEPYLLRRSGGSTDIVGSDREFDKIIGGTVAWNQMVKNGDFSNGNTDWIVSQYLTTTVADKVMTTVCTSSGDRYNSQSISFTVGHKYFLAFDGYSDSSNYQSNSIAVVYFGAASNYKDFKVSSANTWQSFSTMFECVSNTYNIIRLRNAVQGDTNKYRNVRIIDLTQMLGSTIADYVYGLEQNTADAGIAMLKSWGFFTKDYYEYDSGSLQSVKTSAHKTVGKNLIVKPWTATEFPRGVTFIQNSDGSVSVSGTNNSSTDNSEYYISRRDGSTGNHIYLNSGTYILSADGLVANMNITFAHDNERGNYEYIGKIDTNTPTLTFTFTKRQSMHLFVVVYKGKTVNTTVYPMVRLASAGNAIFEPYWSKSYPLDSSLELRGIPKLDGSNKLYYDGDTYASDGTVTRRYGIVNLGSLNWDYSNSRFQSTGINSTAKTYADNVMPHIVCSRYTTFKPSETGSTALGITLFESNGTKYIRVIDPTYTDKNTFKTAMNGVYLVYELATPTTETADPFHDPQICSPYGTEEYVDTRDVPIPVGHETKYVENLKEKLQRLPSISNEDGIYVIEQDDGQMELTTLTGGNGISISGRTISADMDTALTSETKPAQAKAVGDEIRAIGGEISDLNTELDDLHAETAPAIKSDALSGDIVTFDNGADNWPVNECVISVDAVQDLHGYDHPWPAGGNKNLFDGTFLQGYWAFADGTWANSAIWITTSKIPCKASTAYTASADTKMTRWQGFVWYDSNGDYISTDNSSTETNIGMTKTSPSNAAYMVFNIAGYPSSQQISPSDVTHFQLEEGSSATTWVPYSNECPISGWSNAKITRAGKNLIANARTGASGTSAGVSWAVNADGSYTLNGTATKNGVVALNPTSPAYNATTVIGAPALIIVPANTPIYHCGVQLYGYFTDNMVAYNTGSMDKTPSNPAKTSFVRDFAIVQIRAYISTGVTYSASNSIYPMVSIEPFYEYEQAKSQTFTIDLDGTRYGGTLDVTRGKLMVDMIETVFAGVANDVITSWYIHMPSGWADGRFVLRMSNTPHKSNGDNNSINPWALSDKFKKASFNAINAVNAPQYSFAPQENWDTAIIIYVPNKTTVEEYLAWFAENPTEIVYKLATPIEVDLTPTEVSTILGLNHIWADCGTIERLVLTEDTKGYVDQDKYSKAPVITDTASGEIASFPDGADSYPLKECVVDVDAVQDLHGYDHPWPAGGGKNKIDFANVTGTSGTVYASVQLPAGTYYVYFFANSQSWNHIFNYSLTDGDWTAIPTEDDGYAVADYSSSAYNRAKNKITIHQQSYIRLGIQRNDNIGTNSVDCLLTTDSTNYADISTNDLKKTSTYYNQMYVPYSNICPISGWSEAKVTRTGKNLLDKSKASMYGQYFIFGGDLTTVDDTLFLKAGTYTISTSEPTNMYLEDSEQNRLIAAQYSKTTVTFENPKNQRCKFSFVRASSSQPAADQFDYQLELGSTATEYEPYKGRIFTISLGDTRYGCVLDVTRGKLMVTHGLAVFNGSETWNDYPQSSGYFRTIADMKRGTRQNGISNMLLNNRSKNGFWLGVDNKYFFALGVYESMGATMADFKTYLSTHNLEVVYPLETPIEIDLTPTEITTLLGINNIWANTGGIELTYACDTRKFIEKIIASL